MATIKTLKKKLKDSSKQVEKLEKQTRKNAIELCITLARDLTGRMGEDKLAEKLADEGVSFESKNYFDSAETIEDTPTRWEVAQVFMTGVKVIDSGDGSMFSWAELETDTIELLADALANIHEEIQKHI